MGELILEVVQAPEGTKIAADPSGPARLWGISFLVEDLAAPAAALGENLGEPRDAVQPGRRIVTVASAAGLGPADRLHDPRRGGNRDAMKYRPLGRTGIEVSGIGYGAWGIGGSQWGGADDDESIQALQPRDRPRAQLHRHRARLRQRPQRAARRAGRARAPRVDPRGDQGAAREPDLAGARRRAGRGGLSSRPHQGLRRAQPLEPRARPHRPPAAARLERRVGRPGRLARGGRGAALVRQDRLLRDLDQRPPAAQRPAGDRERRGRHGPGHLQRVRPVARGRAVPGLPRARRRRDRARAARRGRPDRHDRAGHRVPGRGLPRELLPRRAQAGARRARERDHRRPWHRRGRAAPRSRCASC